MSTLALRVNGEPVLVPGGTTVADLVRDLTGEQHPRGVAVALDRAIVPRSEWATTRVHAGRAVEVVEAAAGG